MVSDTPHASSRSAPRHKFLCVCSSKYGYPAHATCSGSIQSIRRPVRGRLFMGESATEPGSEQRRCFVSAIRETLAVANAEGVELTEADLTQMVHLIEGIDPAGMPSMAQDRVARRKTEVEEFAGTICRLAAKHDIQVPQNDWLYQRIRDIEASW